MKYLLAFLLTASVLILFRPLKESSESKTEVVLPPNSTILAVGDSLTYGYGIDKPELYSYPAILQNLTGLRVVNAGLSGETSEGGLYRLPGLLEKYKPDLTILCYGGNDILRRMSREELKSNIKKMIDLITKSGSKVVLIGVPDIGIFGLDSLELYSDIAKEYNIPAELEILPKVISDSNLKSDYIHPNKEGYRLIAKAVYRVIKQNFDW